MVISPLTIGLNTLFAWLQHIVSGLFIYTINGLILLELFGIDVFEFYGLVCLAVLGSLAIVLLIAARFSEDKSQGIIKQVWNTYFGGDDDREYPAELRKPPDKD